MSNIASGWQALFTVGWEAAPLNCEGVGAGAGGNILSCASVK